MSQLAILAVILLFSGMVRGAFTVLLLTISYYLTCNGLPVVRQSLEQKIVMGENVSTFMLEMLKWLTAVFPDFSRFDYKRYVFAVDIVPDFTWVVINSSLLLLYAFLALWCSCAIYRRRDLK